MKKNIVRDRLIFIPVALMIILIFYMSSQEGEISTGTSRELTIALSGNNVWEDYLEELHILIRCAAHFSEYAALAFFTGIAVGVNGFRYKLRYIYMFLTALTISLLDEFYQIFIPGRYCDLSDVITDCLGAGVSILFFCLIDRFAKRKSQELAIKRKFMNITIDDISFEQAITRIMKLSEEHSASYILTPNADHIVKLQKDTEFQKVYEQADMVVIDGSPILWIGDSLGVPFKEKITGADMLPKVCERAAKEDKTVFILGAGKDVAKTAAEALKKKYKGIRIVGIYGPSMEFEEDDAEIEKAIAMVNQKNPDILVLSLGSPKQEKFIYKYREKMKFGVALPFGAAVDFAAGNINRAPEWMRKADMEWLYRFFQEPGRLFKRYFITDIQIFYYAWKYRYAIREDSLQEEI